MKIGILVILHFFLNKQQNTNNRRRGSSVYYAGSGSGIRKGELQNRCRIATVPNSKEWKSIRDEIIDLFQFETCDIEFRCGENLKKILEQPSTDEVATHIQSNLLFF